MHEASLVESLLNQVVDLAASHLASEDFADSALTRSQLTRAPLNRAAGARQITRIELEIGPLSGVEPELMALAFQRLAGEAGLSNARLEIVHVPLTIQCDDCQRVTETEQVSFGCDGCGSRRVTVLRGDSCILKSVELESEDVEP
ncbi:MAG: hydrogenase maturation nickel metallochaperone HypA [Pirellulales bacterium]